MTLYNLFPGGEWQYGSGVADTPAAMVVVDTKFLPMASLRLSTLQTASVHFGNDKLPCLVSVGLEVNRLVVDLRQTSFVALAARDTPDFDLVATFPDGAADGDCRVHVVLIQAKSCFVINTATGEPTKDVAIKSFVIKSMLANGPRIAETMVGGPARLASLTLAIVSERPVATPTGGYALPHNVRLVTVAGRDALEKFLGPVLKRRLMINAYLREATKHQSE
jgi:hypothetical protein